MLAAAGLLPRRHGPRALADVAGATPSPDRSRIRRVDAATRQRLKREVDFRRRALLEETGAFLTCARHDVYEPGCADCQKKKQAAPARGLHLKTLLQR
jgi:hypothetical protein